MEVRNKTMSYTSVLCGDCDGTGFIDDDVCPSCDGDGLVEMGSHK